MSQRRYPLSAVRHPLRGAVRYPLLLGAAFLLACSPKGDALYQRAEQALEKGEVRAAIIDLKNLVKDEPNNGKARALLAAALAQDGQVNAAAVEIEKARELGVPAEALQVADCRVMVARGQYDAVLEKCSPEGATGDAKARLQMVTGRALLGLDRAAEARPLFEAAVAAQPDSLDALLGLASAVYGTDGLPGAKTVLDGAPEAIKAQSNYWVVLGRMNMQGEDFAAAEQAFEKAIASAEKAKDKDKDAGAGGSLVALAALAEAQLRQGKTAEATATAERLAKAAPNDPVVKQLRGQIAAADGRLDEARTLLEEAVAAMPQNNDARLLLGVVNMQQNNLGQAEMHFTSVVTNEPRNVRAQQLLAEVRSRLKSPEESLASMRSALTAEDADPSLLAMAGRMSLASGDREQAIAYLTQAAAKGGEAPSADVQLEIAGSYVMAGDLDRAIELLEKMPSDGTANLQREYLLLLALMRQGQNDKAIAEAKALVERSGNDPQARRLAAGVLAAVGQRDAAREQLAEVLKVEPKNAAALVDLGRIDLLEGKAPDAEARFRSAVEADPGNLLATVGLAVALAGRGETAEAEKWLQKAGQEHPDSLEAQMVLAQFYLGTRDFAKAKGVVDAAAKKWPDNAALSNVRGFALMGAKDVPGAIAAFKQATTQAPKAYGYALNLARAHFANGDLDGALGVLNGVTKAEPRYLPALVLAAAISLQAGQVEKAAGFVERLRQAAPDAVGTYMLEGDVALAQKRYRDALQHYRKAAAKGNNRQIVLGQFRAATLAGEPRPEKVLEEWLVANPRDAEMLALLAETRQQAGDDAGAIRHYEQALEHSPGNVIVLNNLAMLYQAKGDPKALGAAEQAYKAAPKAAAIQDTYGWILFQNGRTEEALKLLREAARGLPDNAEVQYHLGSALAKQGEKQEAVTLLRKAVNGQLPPAAKAQAQKLLDQLTQ